MTCRGVRQDDPLTLGDHIDEFFVEEGQVVVARFMRAPEEGALNMVTSPRRRGEPDGRAVVFIKRQQAARRVVYIV